MLPCIRTQKSANLRIFNSLFTILLSPLSRPLGCLVNSPASYPEGNSEGRSPRYWGGNSEDNAEGYPAGNQASRSLRNLENSRGDCPESNPARCSENCPDDCPEDNRENNLPSNPAGNSRGYPEICSGSYQVDARRSAEFGPDALYAGLASSVLERAAYPISRYRPPNRTSETIGSSS
jgi:hypothetical protein